MGQKWSTLSLYLYTKCVYELYFGQGRVLSHTIYVCRELHFSSKDLRSPHSLSWLILLFHCTCLNFCCPTMTFVTTTLFNTIHMIMLFANKYSTYIVYIIISDGLVQNYNCYFPYVCTCVAILCIWLSSHHGKMLYMRGIYEDFLQKQHDTALIYIHWHCSSNWANYQCKKL